MTASELTASIGASYEAYAAELRQAGPHWERKPAGAAEGEDAWPARRVAEHIASASTYFGNGIAAAAGLQAPEIQRLQFTTQEEAVAGTESVHAAFMAVASQLSDSQVAIEFEHPRMGKTTIGGILTLVSNHLRDHANQLKTLREA
jgi:hypothetical protein